MWTRAVFAGSDQSSPVHETAFGLHRQEAMVGVCNRQTLCGGHATAQLFNWALLKEGQLLAGDLKQGMLMFTALKGPSSL